MGPRSLAFVALSSGCSLWHDSEREHHTSPSMPGADAGLSDGALDAASAESTDVDAGTGDGAARDGGRANPGEDAGCAPLELHEDFDGDGHGHPERVRVLCEPEPGWVLTDNDCDDADPAVWRETERGCVPPGSLACADKGPYCDALSTCIDQAGVGRCLCPGTHVDVARDGSECRPAYRASVSFGQRDQDERLGDLVRDREGNLWLSAEIHGELTLGAFHVGETGYSMLLSKLSPSGEVLWAESFDGPEWHNALTTDRHGAVWWTGYYVNGANFGGDLHQGLGNQLFVAKRNADGSHALSAGFGGSGKEHGLAIAAHENSVFVAGNFEGTLNLSADGDPDSELRAVGGLDIFIAEFDLAGKHLWSTSFGGPDDDWPRAITASASGIAIAADYRGYIALDGQAYAGRGDQWTCFLGRFGPDRKVSQAHGFELGDSDDSRCLAYDLLEDATGALWMTGYYVGGFSLAGGATVNAPGLGLKAFLLKVSAAGEVPVARTFGAAGALNSGESLAAGPDGAVWLAGKSIGDVTFADPGQPYPALPQGFVAVAQFDARGRHLRSMRFGNDKDGFVFRIASNGSRRLFLAGAFPGSFSLSGLEQDSLPGDGVYRDLFLGSFEF
jgi:hypothetical protein